MADGRRGCVGGPLDGKDASGVRVAWAFIDGDGRAHPQATQGRALYVNRGECWEFAGVRAFVCAGCGALIGGPGKVAPAGDGGECPFCGAAGQPDGGAQSP